MTVAGAPDTTRRNLNQEDGCLHETDSSSRNVNEERSEEGSRAREVSPPARDPSGRFGSPRDEGASRRRLDDRTAPAGRAIGTTGVPEHSWSPEVTTPAV